MSSTNLAQTGYMDAHHGSPSAESIYGLSHYYTGDGNPSSATASESWKNHQEQYSSSYATSSSVQTKEGFSRDVDGRYQHSSVGGSTTVPQASVSPYNGSEAQSLHGWNRNSSIPNEEIGECSRSAATYDCY